jgi:hypothetical protein
MCSLQFWQLHLTVIVPPVEMRFKYFSSTGRFQKKRAHLLTPQDWHWYAIKRTLSARPMGRASNAVSLGNYQFRLGQQPKPQIFSGVFSGLVLADADDSTTAARFVQVRFCAA